MILKHNKFQVIWLHNMANILMLVIGQFDLLLTIGIIYDIEKLFCQMLLAKQDQAIDHSVHISANEQTTQKRRSTTMA